MINFKVRDPLKACDLARDLAEEDGKPYKVVHVGKMYCVRKASSKGSWVAMYEPIPHGKICVV